MPVRTKSIAESSTADDGVRLLITRYRPRGVRRGEEAWDAWEKRLAPSVELLDSWYGRRRDGRRVVERDLPGISWKSFTQRFDKEMREESAGDAIAELRARSQAGQTITLLCYCADEDRCHRGLVRKLLA